MIATARVCGAGGAWVVWFAWIVFVDFVDFAVFAVFIGFAVVCFAENSLCRISLVILFA